MFFVAQVSCDIFGGFRLPIRLPDVRNHDEIIAKVKRALEASLVALNLTMLLDKLKKRQFHIHGVLFKDIEHGQQIFVCSC